MLTLQNFDNRITGAVLKRGKQYYDDGNVWGISEMNEGCWIAEVEGSELYEVEVQLHKNDKVLECSCNCPYDAGICKHIVAVLFTIREENVMNIDVPETKAPKKLSFQDLLEKITHKEFKEFVREYASKDKDFKVSFELAFADKDETIDLGKKYSNALKRVILKHSDNGYVGYRDAIALTKETGIFLVNVEELIHKKYLRDAFLISKVILNEMRDVLTYCDDSNGNIGDTVSETVSLIGKIATDAPVDLREEIFNYLLNELDDKSYFEYGDFGYEIFDIFEQLTNDLGRSEDFLKYIDSQILKLNGKYDDFRKNFFIARKIEFLKASGSTSEVEGMIQQNLEIVEIRQGEINKFIMDGDFKKAKSLINDGIVIAKSKDHPGTVSQWEKELLRIAYLEKDIKIIRHYTELFAFDRWFSKEYYDQWKATFSVEEWKTVIESHIDETIKKILKNTKSGSGKFWFARNPPLLSAIASVYIEEGYWDRLFELVKKETDLDVILQYHSYLFKTYPEELLALYLPAIEQAGDHGNARNHYKDLVTKMKKIIKDIPQFKADIIAMAEKLKSKYPRRPAMVDELNNITGSSPKESR